MHSVTLVRTLALVVAAGSTGLTHAAAPDRATLDKIAALSVPFVPNAGQWDARAAFAAKTFAGTLFVTRSGEIVYSLPGKLVDPAHATDAADGIGCALRTKTTPGAPSAPYAASCRAPTERTPGWALSETLIDASGKPRSMSQSTVKAPAGFLPMPGKVSYAIGNDPSKHADNLNSYERVNLGDMYPTIKMPTAVPATVRCCLCTYVM